MNKAWNVLEKNEENFQYPLNSFIPQTFFKMNKAEQADGDMPMPQDYLRLSMLKKVRVQVQT